MRKGLAALFLLAMTTVCFAQAAAPAAPADAPAYSAASAEVPADACTQPKLPERYSIPHDDIVYLEKQVNAYGACVKAYVEARQASAQKYSDLAKAEADAGNAAVKMINDYYAKVKSFEASHQEQTKGTVSGVGN